MRKKPTRPADDRLCSTLEVARILNVHPQSIHTYYLKLPGFPKPMRVGGRGPGGRLSFWHSEIVAYANSNVVAVPAAAPAAPVVAPKAKRRAAREAV
jgi:hypothetical protein